MGLALRIQGIFFSIFERKVFAKPDGAIGGCSGVG